MANNDTAALVVALSAQLTKFEKDMRQAGVLADKTVSDIEDKFSRANPSISTSFLGNLFANMSTKGIEAAIKFVTDLKDRFLELPDVAKYVGQSLNDIWGFQEAAASAKVPIDDATKSLKGLAALLDQMQRGETNSLSKLFDANPAALQGVNREALTLQQTFGIVADLVQNARTEIQKFDISAAAGQTDTMVKFLEKGGAAVRQLSTDAAAAAPDLQKLADQAKVFDDAWHTAVKNVKAYLSENVFEVFRQDLTDVIALLGGAVKFLQLFRGGLIDNSTQSAAGEIDRFRQALVRLRDTQNQRQMALLDDPSAFSSDKPKAPSEGNKTGGGTSTRDDNRGLTNVPLKTEPKGNDGLDSFDRTEEQITRRTASLNADTIAIFQNNAAQAQLRAEFQLLNAIRKDEGEVTQEQIDRYQKLRETMSAEQTLIQARINLTPEHRRSFISASEGAQIATANFDAARDSLNKLNAASSQLGSALSSAFADAVVEGKSLNDVMSSLIKTIEKAAINSVFASFFNAPSSGGLSPFSSALKGIIPGFADGTDFAPGGIALVGERGPELVNLPRGSQVVPNNVASRGGGGSFTLNLVEDSSRGGQTRKEDNGAGGFDMTIFVDAITAKNAANPGSATSQVLAQRGRLASR
ncbi:MAG: hypothetical protein CFE29_03200 [Bradyrhizobiaceae bacterium PARB1]|jgi:hypothetical protein|nr:MAG: hypothetical protein CFE29_03200 [Bradyrhizobiaceae bacterium PARB1]